MALPNDMTKLSTIIKPIAINTTIKINQTIFFILRLLFYCLPVVYPLKFVPVAWQGVYLMNPLAVLIHSYRQILFYGQMPDVQFLIVALLQGVLIFFAGYICFNRLRKMIPERV